MSEDSKKNHEKKKGGPKDQRKPRQRHQQSGADKKAEKQKEEPKNVSKMPQKPVHESPPPEFYKNLKRETDEILKITEEENAKYKKKEIQSNWSKYEMPIDSYEEIEEHENLGADYEKLIQAPPSIGGHFQFKHEKTWDMNTGPSLYDKYFDINMEDLNIALCSIPFYKRNSIEETYFTQTDILTMNNRSIRFKQKYYNDKSYSTPETLAEDKIVSCIRDSMKDDNIQKETNNDIEIKSNDRKKSTEIEFNLELNTEPIVPKHDAILNDTRPINSPNNDKEYSDFVFGDIHKKEDEFEKVEAPSSMEKPVCHINAPIDEILTSAATAKVTPEVAKVVAPAIPKVAETPPVTIKNPVIESPEDLEKWLDDFLDG